ncbi:MAG: ECF transporter S component [Clostridia bacterium]|nr:ECF transporter S component [Clostridia bacterium]
MRNVKKLVLSALFLALGMVLPFFTGQIKEIGNMLLPMHLPVLLCGLICGPAYGLAVGFILPLLRSVCFGMPMLYPNALSMAFELATYGLVIGLLFSKAKWKCIRSLYVSLLCAMVSGRLVWGIVQCLLLGFGADGFTLQMFWAGAILNALPGIALQLVLIPAIMLILRKTHLPNRRKGNGHE